MLFKISIKFSIYTKGGQISKNWRWYDVLFLIYNKKKHTPEYPAHRVPGRYPNTQITIRVPGEIVIIYYFTYMIIYFLNLYKVQNSILRIQHCYCHCKANDYVS